MNRIRQKRISRLLLVFMLLLPVTSMAMQLSIQDYHHSAPCHETKLTEHVCSMSQDCQQTCQTINHCSVQASILLDKVPVIQVQSDKALVAWFNSGKAAFYSNPLLRPPKA